MPRFTLGFPAFGIPLAAAQAIQVGLFTEIFGLASSTSGFLRHRLVDFRLAGFALLFAVPAAVVGGLLANVLPSTAVLLAISAAMRLFSYLLFRAPKEEVEGKDEGDYGHARKSEGVAMVEHRDRGDASTVTVERTIDSERLQ